MAANCYPGTTVVIVPGCGGVIGVPATPTGSITVVAARPVSVPPWHTVSILPRRHG
ncbi:MAG TPA: hypothetical protein VL652_41390 [Kutzneria sp.]|jgi:hypothetical protein|nr:hypothetical protein [Kutzneria sp.]